jgi:hypothetical protein
MRNDRIPSDAVISNFTNGVAELSLSPPQWRASQAAQEYLAEAVHIAKLQVEADMEPREEYGQRKQLMDHAIGEAEMELTTACFLLDDKDAEAAEDLLELEAQRQPVIAQQLRARLDELRARTQQSIVDGFG